MTTQTLGIVREWKTETERRCPVTPEDTALLAADGVSVLVEPSPHRVFTDAEMAAAGATVTEDVRAADVLIGIKEMSGDRLRPAAPHLFFSHTIKAQSYNMPLLRRVMELECTLLDYELVTEGGRRLVFFGREAGQAGMINSLWSLGQRLLAQGVDSPLAELQQARSYPSLEAAMTAVRNAGRALRSRPLPAPHDPLVVAVTGIGNVSRGAQEILDLLDPVSLEPAALRAGQVSEGAVVAKVVLDIKDLVRRATGDGASEFTDAEYLEHPDRFRSIFTDYVPRISLLVTGNYWDPRFPRLLEKAWLRSHLASGDARLTVIGDVSCDVEGGVECTVRACTPDEPTFVWHPETDQATAGFAGEGLLVMAVDILPSELPREASATFSRALRPFLRPLLACDFQRPSDALDLPPPLRRAVVVHRGRLEPPFAWLQEHLPA